MKTRKLLALVLAIAMIATIFVVPSAAVAPGAACEILGLLEGDGEGVTAEYLAKGTTRAQGLLITLRARGLEAEAKAFTGTDTFTDAAEVNAEFWGPILAYAYANPELGWVGDGDGTFRPADVMSGAELAKVMLALLGYTQGVDFEWADIATFAASKGVTVVEGNATNDDLAASLVEALALETTEGTKLVDVMIADGVVTEEDALAAEVKAEPVDEAAFAVEVAGVKTIKATFAEAQDTATAVVSLKKGVVGQAVTVTWDTAKKVATLAKTTNLTKGDYTVTINGEAVDFTVEADETATELVVGASTVYAKAGAQDIKIHLLNQYGEKMTFTSAQIVGGSSLGTLAFTTDSATLTVAAGDKGKTATIFAYYSPKNFTVNATITVVEDQKLASIVFVGPIAQGDASKALTRLTAGTAGNTLAFKALDQYGNTLNLTNYVQNTDYSLVVSGATVGVTDGKLTLAGLTAGTFSVRAIVMATGSVSEMYTETVYAVPALASFDVTVPDALYANAAADFAIAGVDQYGKAFAVDSSILTITPLSTTVTIGAKVNASNKVTLTFAAKGTADLYFTTGALTVTKAINVQAEKTVASIVSIPVTTQALLVGKSITLDTSKVVLNDQYGNKIADPGWSWELRRLAETNVYGVVSTGTDATALTLSGMAITAQKAGAEQLRLTLYTGGAYGSTATSYKEFTYDFALSAVAASAVVTYELNVADTMYAGAVSAAHDLAITLVGKTANGTTVTLSSTADSALPTIVAQYTVTGANVAIATATSKLTTVAGVTADTTAVVKAWNNAGVVVAEKTVALKKAAPVVTTVTMAYTASSSTVAVTAKDQYGVAITAPAGNFYSSDTTKLTVDAAGLVTRVPATATTAIIRFVSNDGLWAREVSVTK
ncbi:MAG: Xaa-Pro dipeptidyl-peptidase [Firmicutes bacterium ADurb.Bin146]|nr:MAG: Xaa-Pro dipeptidyl-peptidase [Firmicutes bacterium ADurb.Bin146]